MRLHPHAAGLVAILDPDWRRKLWRAGLVLMIPFVGWPAVLGYRTAFVRRLLGPSDVPLLPSWDEGILKHAVTGLRAMCVIFGYLAPLYLGFGLLAASRGWVPGADALALTLFFAAFPIFSTLSFPTACLALASGGWLGTGECLAGLAAFALLVFLVPAGFLEVSRTGRYASAFAFQRTLPFVARNFAAYLEAWWHSSVIALAGHLTLPLAPWGVVWCYFGIVMLFNELLRPERGGTDCWLERALGDPRLSARTGGRCLKNSDARGEPAVVLGVGAFSAPLPDLLRRWLVTGSGLNRRPDDSAQR